MNIRTLALPLALLVAGCSSTPEAEPITSAPLGVYKTEEIQPLAETLMDEIKLSDNLKEQVALRLKEMLADKELEEKLKVPGVSGVGVFQFGSGGMIFAGGAGGGIVAFAEGTEARIPFHAEAWSVGATMGGQTTFGVVLVFGLLQEETFTDDYSFSGHGGTIGAASFRVGHAVPDNGTHEIYFCGSGFGAGGSAAVGSGKLVLKRGETLVDAENK